MGVTITAVWEKKQSSAKKKRKTDEPNEELKTERVELFSGSYMAFACLRQGVAEVLGMMDYKEWMINSTTELLFPSIKKKKYKCHRMIKANPAYSVFFYSSDCDGVWNTEQAKLVLSVVDEALEKLAEKNEHLKHSLQIMHNGLKSCVKHEGIVTIG